MINIQIFIYLKAFCGSFNHTTFNTKEMLRETRIPKPFGEQQCCAAFLHFYFLGFHLLKSLWNDREKVFPMSQHVVIRLSSWEKGSMFVGQLEMLSFI